MKKIFYFFSVLFLTFTVHATELEVVGKLERRVELPSRHVSYFGSVYFVDAQSFQSELIHRCQEKMYAVTANHVLKGANLGDKAEIRLPVRGGALALEQGTEDDENKLDSVLLSATIYKRDLESDVAVLEMNEEEIASLKKREGHLLCIGAKVNLPLLDLRKQNIKLKGFAKDSLILAQFPSYRPIYDIVEMPHLLAAHDYWGRVESLGNPGMSGGLVMNSSEQALGMILKKRYQVNADDMPLTYFIPMVDLAPKLKELIFAEPLRSYRYLYQTEEVEYQGLVMSDIPYALLKDMAGGEAHDVAGASFEGSSGGEVEKILADLKKSRGVQLVRVLPGSPHFALYAESLRNGVSLIKKINDTPLENISDLLRFLRTQAKKNESTPPKFFVSSYFPQGAEGQNSRIHILGSESRNLTMDLRYELGTLKTLFGPDFTYWEALEKLEEEANLLFLATYVSDEQFDLKNCLAQVIELEKSSLGLNAAILSETGATESWRKARSLIVRLKKYYERLAKQTSRQ